jgi:hypothetical protein
MAKADVDTVRDEESNAYDSEYSKPDTDIYEDEDDDEEYHVVGKVKSPIAPASSSASAAVTNANDKELVQAAKQAAGKHSKKKKALDVSPTPPRGLSFDSSNGRTRRDNDILQAAGRSISLSGPPDRAVRGTSFSLNPRDLFRPNESDMDEDSLAVRTMSVT